MIAPVLRTLLPFAAALLSQAAAAREIPLPDAECDPTVAHNALDFPFLSAHRGGVNLAPENTIWAYRYAFAYEVDTIEIDVRETADGRFFSMHDGDVDRTTDGTGMADAKTSLELSQLNAANFEPWIGSEYDPTPVPFLEEILELAEQTGRGIEFDLKSVRNYPLFLALIAQYPGVYERSFFNANGLGARAMHLYEPRTRFIYNLSGDEPADRLRGEADTSSMFGSSMAKFTEEPINAIHDGCGWIIPHSYDEGPEEEAAQFLEGRARGIDGAQINQPDVIRGIIGQPVATELRVSPERPKTVCLVNASNGLGLPYKWLNFSGVADGSVETRKAGCTELPVPADTLQIEFSGDTSALPSQLNMPLTSRSLTATAGGSLDLSLLALIISLALVSRAHRIPRSK